MSVQNKILARLKAQDWVSNSEFEDMFPKGIEGHYSWPQRLRGLREPKNGGFNVIRRTQEGTKNLSEWHLEEPEPPRTEQEALVAENFQKQEEVANFKAVGQQLTFT